VDFLSGLVTVEVLAVGSIPNLLALQGTTTRAPPSRNRVGVKR
jgi:hypothetical protein